MHHLKLIFLVSTFMFSFAFSVAHADSKWKLQPLAQASNALLVEMDEASTAGKGPCGMRAAQVSQASQKLQSLIDQRINELQNNKVQSQTQIQSLQKSCVADCTCDIYAYALEKLDISEAKSEKPVLFTMAQRKSCRSGQKAICHGAIIKYLKK